MNEARFYEKLEDNKVICKVCWRSCVINSGKKGFCNIKQNVNGTLHSLVYGRPVAIHIDPIEKKPIYNYLKGTKTLSVGTVGCNFDCQFCQNHDISKATTKNIKSQYIEPNEIVAMADYSDYPSISYTYTEPTIFVEYALDIMKLAKEKGLKNVWVSNGYMQKEVAEEVSKYLDAINIDLKGDKEFYKQLVNGIDIEKVKENIRFFYSKGIHIEITNLLIEGYNTKKEQIEELVDFIASISKKIPIHFSRSFGYYKMKHIIPTKIKTLKLAENIAKEKGIKFIYLGNI